MVHSRQVQRILLAGLACAVWVASSAGQERAPAGGTRSEPLRAEIGSAATLYTPDRPIRLRFTLFNPSEETVEIPFEQTSGANEGVTLPIELILGNSEQPAIFVTFQDEKPVAVRTDWPHSAEPAARVLRLAPHGSVGAEIDLRELHAHLRYAGDYVVEWRPPGVRLEAASLRFRVEARKDAILVTDHGKITFSLLYEKAPRNVDNFLELIRDKFYDGKTIHRIVPGFILQGGCPLGNGRGLRPDGKTVPPEFHDTPFELGTLAMARKPSDPASASCQFFVSLARLQELDGKYTIIGQARDEDSLRTLRQLESLAANAEGRPLRPLVIRFISLVDAE